MSCIASNRCVTFSGEYVLTMFLTAVIPDCKLPVIQKQKMHRKLLYNKMISVKVGIIFFFFKVHFMKMFDSFDRRQDCAKC